MSWLHQKEREQFKRIFAHEQVENREELLKVLEAFLSTEDHVTVNRLHEIYRSLGGILDQSFVEQAMEIMVKYGFAHRLSLKGQPVSYEHRHLGIHHDHLVCIRCGKIEEFYLPELEWLQDKVAARHGFYNLQHRLEIYGLCRACSTERPPLISLSMASAGERVEIDHFRGDRGMQFRLAEMGLNPGRVVELISSNGGPVVVALGESRLALGRGIAHKIMVRRLPDKAGESSTHPPQ